LKAVQGKAAESSAEKRVKSMRQPGDHRIPLSPPQSEKTLAVLGAFCLFLSTIEYMIPKPLPFLRLGLANFPLLLALKLNAPTFWTLVLIKVLAQALISGTFFSYVFLFSLSGAASSAALMFALYHLFYRSSKKTDGKKMISLIGISVAGAFISNITQIVFARFFILGKGALYIAPPFLALGIASGFLLGLFAQKFSKESQWYKNCDAAAAHSDNGVFQKHEESEARFMISKETYFFIAGMILSLVLLLIESPLIRLILFAVFWIVAAIRRRAGNPLITVLVFLGIVLFNISIPYGKVLFSIGSFPVTQGALFGALKKAATVEGLLMISKVAISKNFRFPGKLGALLSESFRILSVLNEHKIKITPKNFIGEIDSILLEAEYL
jgi:heptaprenyl diphosphate synthase